MMINGDSNAIPMGDGTVDAVIADPPYGLSFMGRDWDRAVPGVAIWNEVLRVLKPGAFAAILCTPRQDCQARMIMNLEAAGFVTGFSSIMYTYATGFPKAASLSKLCDKRLGAEREIVGKNNNVRPGHRGQGCDNRLNIHHYTANESITAPATPEAKALDGAYAGWQPKPAFEPVLIVMKPLAHPTYLDQALDNGKGCSWLDDARIPTGDSFVIKTGERTGPTRDSTPGSKPLSRLRPTAAKDNHTAGRFPANVLCSDDALDDGRVSKSVGRSQHKTHTVTGWARSHPNASIEPQHGKEIGLGDSGSYSRYFDLDAWWTERVKDLPESVRRVFPWLIVAKPSKREKNAGLDVAPVTVGDGRTTPIDNPFQRGKTERVNSHVSVKPVRLMSYLITLFSRPGDVVLDPFAGSGTTGVAAEIMDRRFVGVELDPEYAAIAAARTVYAEETSSGTMRHELTPQPKAAKPRPPATGQGDLFNDPPLPEWLERMATE